MKQPLQEADLNCQEFQFVVVIKKPEWGSVPNSFLRSADGALAQQYGSCRQR